MRALVCREFGPIENLAIEERDDPLPGDGEIAIDVRAAGLNFADVLGIAGAMGATVIAAASTREKLEFARQAGARHLVDYSRESLKHAVRELTGGRGVDVVYERFVDAFRLITERRVLGKVVLTMGRTA